MKTSLRKERITMSKKLKELVEFGADIEFRFQDKTYIILPWTDDGILIGEKNSEDSIFSSYDDMINEYMLDGKLMKDIVDQIEITFTSGC